MASNNEHQKPEIEVILANTMLEGPSKENKDLSFVEIWVNNTVKQEISRGNRLRQEKPKPDVTRNEYKIAHINFAGSVKQCRESYRKHDLKSFKYKPNLLSTPRSKSPSCCPPPTTPASTYMISINKAMRKINTSQMRLKKSRKCSMRIAELAVPSKRQCIDTWRNKAYILPELMVERLKQHVMDQRPIVKIPEALYCFQQRRPQSSKIRSSRCCPSKNENNYEFVKTTDTRTLSILFAVQITKMLSKPLNVNLDSQILSSGTESEIVPGSPLWDLNIAGKTWENVSRIVYSDIAKMVSKSKCPCNKNEQYKAVYTDISNKITVWIAGILEDLSIKLLEEDLKVIKNLITFPDQLLTAVESIVQQEEKGKSTDLEEEEGPVLDFIDDVVDNVLNICAPLPVYVEETTGSLKDELVEELKKPVSTRQSTDKTTELEEIFNAEETSKGLTDEIDIGLNESENMTDEERFRKEIEHILDKITKEYGNDISNSSRVSIGSENNKEILPDAETEYDENEANIGQINDKKSNAEIHTSNIIEGFEIVAEDSKSDIGEVGETNSQAINDNEEIADNVEEHYSEAIEDLDNLVKDSELYIDPVEDENSNAKYEIEEVNDNSLIHDSSMNEDLEIFAEDSDKDIKTENNDMLSVNENEEVTSNAEQHKSGIEGYELLAKNSEDDVNQTEDKKSHNNEELDDNAENHNSNVSDGFEILSEDFDDHKNSKKVILSLTDPVIPNNLAEHYKTSTTLESVNDEQRKVQRDPQSIKSIIFAEPNFDLLSDADESWPAEISSKSICEFASKTVLALGNITENDEKQLSRQELPLVAENSKTKDTPLEVVDIVEILNNKPFTEQQEAENMVPNNKSYEPPTNASNKKETTISDSTFMVQVDSKTPSDKDVDKFKSIINPKVSEKSVKKASKAEILKLNDRESDLKRTGSTAISIILREVDSKILDKPDKSTISSKIRDESVVESLRKDRYKQVSRESELIISEYDKIPNHEIQSQKDYSWKVHPKTAPSWVTSWEQGRGEPSEDSIPIQIRPTQVTEREIRKWCTDLEKAFTDLEMWNNWIRDTCKETIHVLKEKGNPCPVLAKRATMNWNKFKRNVHKDAIQWTKLYKRSENTFKIYKAKYDNVESSANKPRESDTNKTIFESTNEFENNCLELHKLIVAAEYCVMCSCDRTKNRLTQNS